mmetsp:Transcript_21442/g.45823  ORF Transcript_21442/g.45823 Transcript_21442/m.45823 type:complete len:215 (-) Transcript_21442:781-1425(-)
MGLQRSNRFLASVDLRVLRPRLLFLPTHSVRQRSFRALHRIAQLLLGPGAFPQLGVELRGQGDALGAFLALLLLRPGAQGIVLGGSDLGFGNLASEIRDRAPVGGAFGLGRLQGLLEELPLAVQGRQPLSAFCNLAFGGDRSVLGRPALIGELLLATLAGALDVADALRESAQVPVLGSYGIQCSLMVSLGLLQLATASLQISFHPLLDLRAFP